MVHLVGSRVPQQGGHHGTNQLIVLPPSPPSPKSPPSNHSLSVNIRPNLPILLPMNDTLLHCLPVPASPTMVPNGTTNPNPRSNLPSRPTNNPTSQMGMDIPSRRSFAVMTTIAMVRPRPMGGAVRGRLSTTTTQTIILGWVDAYDTIILPPVFSCSRLCILQNGLRRNPPRGSRTQHRSASVIDEDSLPDDNPLTEEDLRLQSSDLEDCKEIWMAELGDYILETRKRHREVEAFYKLTVIVGRSFT